MSNVLIVSKTRMHGDRVCVGGIDIDHCRSLRLLDCNGYHETAEDCPFNIYDVWDIDYSRNTLRPLPHSNEDVNMLYRRPVGSVRGKMAMVDVLNSIGFNVCKGNIYNVFDGTLKSSDNGTLFISAPEVPGYSTCFWLCDLCLTRDDFHDKIRYKYRDGRHRWGVNIAYVGTDIDPQPFIPGDTLVRLSLAHWWQKSPYDEERCYLQLSGFYLDT